MSDVQAPARILFLNPSIIAAPDAYRPGRVEVGAGVEHTGGTISLRNEPVEAFNRLVASLGAQLVLTHDGSPYDARDQLVMRGVRATIHADWLVSQSTDRSAAIEKWWIDHGRPVALIVERSGVRVPTIPRLSIPEGFELTEALVDQALAMFPARTGSK